MGRSASHIALECALQVQPNVCIISEEVEAKDMSLDDVVTSIAKVVADRAGTRITTRYMFDSTEIGRVHSCHETSDC